MSVLDTLASYTVGIVWRAGTGTVDPWTKQNQVEAEAVALAQAKGSATPSPADSQQALTDVTNTLRLSNSDPSQASIANSAGIENLLYYLQLAGYGLVLAGVVYVVIRVAPLVKKK